METHHGYIRAIQRIPHPNNKRQIVTTRTTAKLNAKRNMEPHSEAYRGCILAIWQFPAQTQTNQQSQSQTEPWPSKTPKLLLLLLLFAMYACMFCTQDANEWGPREAPLRQRRFMRSLRDYHERPTKAQELQKLNKKHTRRPREPHTWATRGPRQVQEMFTKCLQES